MRTARVFRLSMAHPGDLSALEELIDRGTIRAAEVVAVIGKTEGNGGVNDFTRGYFTQTLMGLLSQYLNKPPAQLVGEIPCVLSGGTEGVMSPHYSVFCISEAEPSARKFPSALAIGTAFSAPVCTAPCQNKMTATISSTKSPTISSGPAMYQAVRSRIGWAAVWMAVPGT